MEEIRAEDRHNLAVPIFGDFNPSAKLILRLRAYAVVLDVRQHIAMLSTPQGIFSPCGGPDPGETPQETLREGCGLALRIGRQIGRPTRRQFQTQD